MNTQNPLVSIIVRTKDRPKLLKRSLQSIAAQTYKPIEVILVNDGGCDLDIEELKSILGAVSLNYVRLKKNTGRAHAGNVGIENAQGQYVGFLDDDDEFYPEHIHTLFSFLNDTKNCACAYTDAEIIERAYDDSGNIIKETNRGIFGSYNFSREVLYFENYIPLMCSLLRGTLIRDIGGFDETFEMYEDWDLFIRASQISPFIHIGKTTAKYIHWSNLDQIAFTHRPDARDWYLRVLSKYAEKMTPEILYEYFLTKHGAVERSRILQREIELLSRELNIKIEESRILREELSNRTLEMQTLKEQYALEMQTLKERYALEMQTLKEQYALEMQTLKEQHALEMQTLKEQLKIKTAYIEEIQSSAGWMMLEYYRKNIKNRLAPVGTKRWRTYNVLLKGFKTLGRQGPKVLLGKVKKFNREVKASSSIRHEVFWAPQISCGTIEEIDVAVTVVIPTKNAGHEFRYVIEKIHKQKGIKNINIIVVDSGSEDNTVYVAKRYGAKTFSIHPSEFGHGRTRNYAAGNASGEYLIFLSQDAIPAGDTCFFDIIRAIKKDSMIAAVSAKQIPRSDADLFACWQIWNHNEKFLRYSTDEVVSVSRKTFDSLSSSDKRRIAQIDNIFSCIRKDIFDQFRFNDLPYAEDLDLGLRLITSGYKIGFLSSVGVMHSHNRDSAYYLKRSYIDRKTLIKLVGCEPVDWHMIGINSLSEMIHYVKVTYQKLNCAFQHFKKSDMNNESGNILTFPLRRLASMCSLTNNRPNDKGLDSILDELVVLSGKSNINLTIHMDVLIEQFFSVLGSFEEYLSFDECLDDRFEEIIAALYKLCAIVLGANIGDYVASYEAMSKLDETLKLESILGTSI